ncbi:sensor histidine kinase [Polyangium spumosum]|uniref:histidine kinase n=1 Tax=Polyangium spumosum TaxID=889282 RepID=A0A6N7PKQ5_9BACT|nr:sensor histidine kinase [Polyangium spumosum]
MTSDRLTRNELTWLLAQEARTAAQKLRQGVIIQDGPPGSVRVPEGESTVAVETTLNQLDEAVGMLASLHGHPATRGRRGKIDLAQLLWEVAPEARVQIEMGEGTTVFGDEAELRRMLLLLVGQAGDPANAKGTAEVSVRREGEEVKVSVVLGPDQPATFESERAWLSRMAIRHGGRLELDGSMQTLVLPADVDMQRQELENLKRELKAAQEQGEAYARELAAVFASGAKVASTPPASASIEPVSSEGLAVLVAGVRGLVSELRGIFSAITRDLLPLRDRGGEVGDIVASSMRHVTAASETMGDLARLGACPIGELPRHVDIAEALRDVVRDDVGRAARHDVRVTLNAPQTAYEVAQIGALTVLMHALLDHAISASPPGTEVVLTLSEQQGGGFTLTVDDAGHPLPEAARTGVLSRDFEILAAGRPAGISLIAATAIAAHVRMQLEIDDAPSGGARVRLTIPKMSA